LPCSSIARGNSADAAVCRHDKVKFVADKVDGAITVTAIEVAK
jgi:hypothetical protein